MCGRYAFALDRPRTVALTGSAPDPFPEVAYNQPPGVPVPVLAPENRWESRVWGVEIRIESGKRRWVINARTETAGAKRLFCEAFQSRRCVFPASGFFEWRRREAENQAFYFSPKEHEGILLGGLELDGDEGPRVVVLTGKADPRMAEVHHRAPVLVRPRHLEGWLDPDRPGESALRDCCFAGQEAVLRRHTVSARVNRVKENDASLLEPVPEETVPRQTHLFED